MLDLNVFRFPFLFAIPGLSQLSGLGGLFVRPPTRWSPTTSMNGCVLSVSPAIVFCRPQPRPFGAAHYFASRFPDRPFTFLIPITMSLERRSFALSLALQYRRFRRAHPHAALIVMANTFAEQQILHGLGVNAQFMPQNMFLDETMFRPLPQVDRSFDAIYNAQLAPFKRHELARGVSTCAYITKFFASLPPSLRKTQLDGFLASLPAGHEILNRLDDGVIEPMGHVEVNHAMARAHVGLCLSKLEGAMYASTEYLLAGLPVVSTRSQGGRDTFFHPDTSLIVDDDPRSVRDGVAAMKARGVPPDHVRSTTLKLLAEQRERFNRFVDDLRGHAIERVDPRWSFDYYPCLSQVGQLADFERKFAPEPRRDDS